MKDPRRSVIQALCLIPFFRDILKFLYNVAISKVKKVVIQHPQITDIYLTSQMQDHDFIYGSSDLDLIFVVENTSHPREILVQLRHSLNSLWPVNMLVNLRNLYVFKEIEIQTPQIRSYLTRSRGNSQMTWKSILTNKEFQFTLKEQDHYTVQRNYIRLLEEFLLTKIRPSLINRHWVRSFGKGIYRAIIGLQFYGLLNSRPSREWEKFAKKIIGLSWFSRLYFMGLKVMTFKLIDSEPMPEGAWVDIPESYPNHLRQFTQRLVQMPIVQDVVLRPALIQLHSEEIKDKIFIEVVIGQKKGSLSADSLHQLSLAIMDFLDNTDEHEPKYVFSFTTYTIIKMKAENMLSSYPLEHIYSYQSSHSAMGIKYQFKSHNKQLKKASIFFLLHQFMLFRSMDHRNNLIGSRFIKSLNIIYRYQLLLDHLRGKEFAVSHSYKSIMQDLSPQLRHIKPDDIVSTQMWKIIRAQMLFLLKQIRDELSHKSPSLKNLQF
jgi:hypothetical protein